MDTLVECGAARRASEILDAWRLGDGEALTGSLECLAAARWRGGADMEERQELLGALGMEMRAMLATGNRDGIEACLSLVRHLARGGGASAGAP
ncbi:MAG TPA: hypothetical protein VMU19_15120 [Bryobacteraceae bacterium]|nr:hypothetical protein [Bryobacteraceae bacterium]